MRRFTFASARHRGLTLVELAIGLAVLAILGALALPSLGARLERQRVYGTAQTLAGDVAEARFESARRNQPLYLGVRPGRDWCWAVSAASDCACGDKQVCQVRNVLAADHPGGRVAEARTLRLEPTGGAEAGTLALLETSRGDKLKVEVSAQGRARVCSAGGAWPSIPAC